MTLRFYLTLVRIAKIQNTNENLCQRGILDEFPSQTDCVGQLQIAMKRY